MGYGSYHRDVEQARQEVGTTRSSQDAFAYSARAKAGYVKEVHPDLNIKGKRRECRDSAEHKSTTPIAVLMDGTASRGEDAMRIYEQVPSFLGSLKVSGVVPSPQICWAMIGDANSDRAPLQFGQFESDRRLDTQLGQIWMEEGGGGTGEESYELGAYFLARKTDLDCNNRGQKGFAFFLGDEAPYATVSKTLVERYVGDDLRSDIPTEKIFRELQAKYHPFLIFPRSSMDKRRRSIDTEIQRRLEKAGGRFKDVDIRVSLIWQSRDDLDLHCMTPHGEHIYYGAKRASCRGELDVDRNVSGEDPKPVENIRWAKKDAQGGSYKFWVELYGYHELHGRAVPFKVEIDVDGEITSFEGAIKPNAIGQRGAVTVAEFNFAPGHGMGRGMKKEGEDPFAPYADEVILGKWERYIPAANILRVQEASSAVEVMIGAMALQTGKMDLEAFAQDMAARKVPSKRREDVMAALGEFARSGVLSDVGGGAFV